MHNFITKTYLPRLQNCHTEPTQHYSRRASSLYYNDQQDEATEYLLLISQNQDKNMNMSNMYMQTQPLQITEVAPWQNSKQFQKKCQPNRNRSKTSMLLPPFSRSSTKHPQKLSKQRLRINLSTNNKTSAMCRKTQFSLKKVNTSAINDHQLQQGGEDIVVKEFMADSVREEKERPFKPRIVCVHQDEEVCEAVDEDRKKRRSFLKEYKGLEQVQAIGWLGNVLPDKKNYIKTGNRFQEPLILKEKNGNQNYLTTINLRQNKRQINCVQSSKPSRQIDPSDIYPLQPLQLPKKNKQNVLLQKMQKRMQIFTKKRLLPSEPQQKQAPKLQNKYIKYSHVKNKQNKQRKYQLSSNFNLKSNFSLNFNFQNSQNPTPPPAPSTNPMTKHLYDRYKDILEKHHIC